MFSTAGGAFQSQHGAYSAENFLVLEVSRMWLLFSFSGYQTFCCTYSRETAEVVPTATKLPAFEAPPPHHFISKLLPEHNLTTSSMGTPVSSVSPDHLIGENVPLWSSHGIRRLVMQRQCDEVVCDNGTFLTSCELRG